LWSSPSWITWILCFDYKSFVKLAALEPPAFVEAEPCFTRNGSKLLISSITNIFKLNKVASEGKLNILQKLIANQKGTNRFCKESQLMNKHIKAYK